MPPEPTQQPAPEPAPAIGEQPDALDALDAALGADEPAAADPAAEPEWTPPTREEWEAHQAALEAERGKLKRARDQAKRLREGKQGAAPADPAAPMGPDPQAEVWRDRAVRQAARAQLLERGADREMVDLALARLRAGEVDFDGDEEPILDDWLDQIEERYPKLFAKAPAPAAPGAAAPGRVNQGAASQRPVQRQLSLGERIIAQSEAARTNASRFPRGRG